MLVLKTKIIGGKVQVISAQKEKIIHRVDNSKNLLYNETSVIADMLRKTVYDANRDRA